MGGHQNANVIPQLVLYEYRDSQVARKLRQNRFENLEKKVTHLLSFGGNNTGGGCFTLTQTSVDWHQLTNCSQETCQTCWCVWTTVILSKSFSGDKGLFICKVFFFVFIQENFKSTPKLQNYLVGLFSPSFFSQNPVQQKWMECLVAFFMSDGQHQIHEMSCSYKLLLQFRSLWNRHEVVFGVGVPGGSSLTRPLLLPHPILVTPLHHQSRQSMPCNRLCVQTSVYFVFVCEKQTNKQTKNTQKKHRAK